MVNFTYNNCTSPKMFVALKSACANKKGGREISNFFNLHRKIYLIYGLKPYPPPANLNISFQVPDVFPAPHMTCANY